MLLYLWSVRYNQEFAVKLLFLVIFLVNWGLFCVIS